MFAGVSAVSALVGETNADQKQQNCEKEQSRLSGYWVQNNTYKPLATA